MGELGQGAWTTRKRIALGCLGASVLGAVIGGFVFLVVKLTQPLADAGNGFMDAIKRGAWADACARAVPDFQKKMGCPDHVQEGAGASLPTDWDFTSRNIRNDRGALRGMATFADGGEGTLELDLVQVGEDWKVTGYQVRR